MKTLICSLLLLLACIGSQPLNARSVRFWTPDELAAKSSFVCNGLVLDVIPQPEEKIKHFDSVSPGTIPVRLYLAKIKVLSVLKGQPAETLDLHYYLLDRNKMGGIVNGPTEVSLTKGKRYTFFLNRTFPDSFYSLCLQGSFDDGCSVQPISDAQPDTAAPLGKDRAIKAAQKYIQDKAPGIVVDNDLTMAHYYSLPFANPPRWKVGFFTGNPNSQSSRRELAEIWVNDDGSIDDKKSSIAVSPR